MNDESYYKNDRERMVADQIASRGINDPRLLEAIREIPRHRFVTPDYQHLAYTDGPLPIGQSQTISQPYIVALMTDLLALVGDEKVLEVGTGSGYQAAILGRMSREVHTIERHSMLAERATDILKELNLDNVSVHVGDGSHGLPEFAPYHAIMVTAAAPSVPQPLLDQLAENGRLVLPVGSLGGQILERWQRCGSEFDRESVAPVAFVPLRGDHGWKEGRWGLF